MKSETVAGVRIQENRRHSVYSRKMSTISPYVNGAEEYPSYAAADQSVVRQINLAAAFHDHISCTKSAELCKIDGTRKGRLPCETDHIYATDVKKLTDLSPKAFYDEIKQLKKVLHVQLELIKQLEKEINQKTRQIKRFQKEIAMLKARLDRRDRVSLLRKRQKVSEEDTKNENSLPVVENSFMAPVEANNISTAVPTTPTASELSVAPQNPNTISSINLVTRYFGRSSKTIPSRALKRRYLGPPKTIPSQKVLSKNILSAPSVSSTSEASEDIFSKAKTSAVKAKPVLEKSPLVTVKRLKRRGKRPKGIAQKVDFLTTDKPYYLPVNQASTITLAVPEKEIHVPCWELKPVTSFYQMEGTENINDIVFERRHLKSEKEERRQKRWDIQRLREQKVSEKLKNKYCKKPKKEPEDPLEKMLSLHPDPCHVQYIELTDQLPVVAFGHLIPVFQSIEFSLPWKPGDRPTPTDVSPAKISKRGRHSCATNKVT